MRAYGLAPLRRRILAIACQLEGGRFFSVTLRRILERYHGVLVGAYSYGPCLTPGALPPGTTVGAYCSIADGLKVHRRNHPEGTLSQHPLFYNRALGLVPSDTITRVEDNPLTIGSDVWIGDRVTVLPRCRTIGDGAIVGACSILTRDVEPFSVVVGAPAQKVRMRYDEETIGLIRRSSWWELALTELLGADVLLVEPMTIDRLRAFVARLESDAFTPLGTR